MLSLGEFKAIVSRVNNELLHLPEKELRALMAEADVNDDGVIEYEEFMPIALDLLQALIVKRQVESDADRRQMAAFEDAHQLLRSGLSEQDLKRMLVDIFRKADVGRPKSTARAARSCGHPPTRSAAPSPSLSTGNTQRIVHKKQHFELPLYL